MSQNRARLWDDLKAARRAYGHTQSTLSDAVGVTRETIARMEVGSGSFRHLMSALEVCRHRHIGIALGSNLAEQMRNSRSRQRLNLAQAADMTGLDARTISSLESGQGSLRSADQYLAHLAPNAVLKRVDDALWSYSRGRQKETDSRFTPIDFIDALINAFGEISLDPCSHPLSPVPARLKVCLPDDGLLAEWENEQHIYVNPPFSEFDRWLRKANETWEGGRVKKITVLMPTGRMDIREFALRSSSHATTLHLVDRLHFASPSGQELKRRAPFAMSLVCFGCSDEEISKFRRLIPSLRLDPQPI